MVTAASHSRDNHAMTAATNPDPIAAIATAAGRGGIGVIRLSGGRGGARLTPVIHAILGKVPAPRHATYLPFLDADGRLIDQGIALWFPAPQSYTGEDVLELQGHGGPVVLQLLLQRCLDAGAAQGLRLAQPGEFTQRAFLNQKLDLAQAEAVADLIEASTAAAARSASASMSGAFSNEIHALVEQLVALRMLVEATLDFPEEEIEFLEKSDARGQLQRIRAQLDRVLAQSRQGALLREGLKVVLIGAPNVGKSSLLNALSGKDSAIVTPVPGTTRDKVTETIQIEGIPLAIIDTAGLRDTDDAVERIGIERTWQEIAAADVILHLQVTGEAPQPVDATIASRLPAVPRRTVLNKADLAGSEPGIEGDNITLSAKTGAGIDLLRAELLAIAGWQASGETVYLARQRHLQALQTAREHLSSAAEHAAQNDRVLDLFAEELRLAQQSLSAITGEFSADDLLGVIFGRFCIGK
jgi:tRNA modification GTPase